MQLRYGCNPHQAYAAAEGLNGHDAPIQVLHGAPSMINFLDALNAWQLVSEARAALDLPADSILLTDLPAGADGPAIAVSALRDAQGARLERIQIVKGWVEDGTPRERVIDVTEPAPRSRRSPPRTRRPT